MNGQGKLVSLLETLRSQLATKRDFKADTRRISLWGNGEVKLSLDTSNGVEDFTPTRHCHQQIATHLDVPFKLYERLQEKHPDLLCNLATGLLNREPSKQMIRVLGDQARAFLGNGYRPRDSWDLLEHLMPVINQYPDVDFKECSLTDTRMYIKTFLPSVERNIRLADYNDVLYGGFVISNSEVGSGSLQIYPYTVLARCRNGMTHTEFGKRQIHVGKREDFGTEAYELYSDETKQLDDAAFYAKCADVLRGCLTNQVFDRIAEQMQELAGVTGSRTMVEAVEELTTTHGFSKPEGASILDQIIKQQELLRGGFTGYALVNGITAVARDTEDADRRAELETLAGDLIAAPAKVAALV